MSERWYILPSAVSTGRLKDTRSVQGFSSGRARSRVQGLEPVFESDLHINDEIIEGAEAVFVLPPPYNDS